MSVEFFPCSLCQETICDAGPYYHCGKCGEVICEECIEEQIKKYKFGTKAQKDEWGDDCVRECDHCSKANKQNRIDALKKQLLEEENS